MALQKYGLVILFGLLLSTIPLPVSASSRAQTDLTIPQTKQDLTKRQLEVLESGRLITVGEIAIDHELQALSKSPLYKQSPAMLKAEQEYRVQSQNRFQEIVDNEQRKDNIWMVLVLLSQAIGLIGISVYVKRLRASNKK